MDLENNNASYMTYLKDEIYYFELYDKHTIEKCRRYEVQLRSHSGKSSDAKVAQEDVEQVRLLVALAMMYVKGERYRNKAETIRQWMDCDRKRDEKLTTAVAPLYIRCLGCSSFMECTERDLFTHLDEKKDRVLFLYQCSHCEKRRAYWDNGEEWQEQPMSCPQCQMHMTRTDSRKGKVITSTYTCPGCNHTKSEKLDLTIKHKEEPVDPNFEADRKKYCLSDTEGSQYVIQTDRMKQFSEEQHDREKNKAAYDAVAKIKTLPIADLQALLAPLVQKAGYGRFEVGQPEFRKGVSVDFKLQDTTPGRSEYDSTHTLRKLIQKSLKGTNWHLTSDGITYHLGFLNGRLRGVEGKEALLELAKRDLGKK